MDYLQLNYWQVAAAALLIVINGCLSLWLRLGLERSLLIASVRTVIQLLLIGFILQWVFQFDRWYVVVGILLLMTSVAAVTAVQQSVRRYRGIWWDTFLSVWVSSWMICAYGLLIVLNGIDKWYQPQYAIPLMGMILGNTLNGISIGLSTFTESAYKGYEEIETLLTLGADRWEAVGGPLRHAMTTGMTPIVNSMMIVGLVSLPGMMTGQLLAGVEPEQAVKYQIAIMFLIASATALGTTAAVLLSFRRIFNSRHQFLRFLLKSRYS